MEKGIIATILLLLVSVASIVLIFGVGERLSVITYSDDIYDIDKVLSYNRYRIDMSSPDALNLVSVKEYSGFDLAVDIEEEREYSHNYVNSRNNIELYMDDSLIPDNYDYYGMPNPNISPSFPIPKEVSATSKKISEKVNNAIKNTSILKTKAPNVKVNLSSTSIYRYEPLIIEASIYTDESIEGISIYVKNRKDNYVRENGDGRYNINVFKLENSYKGTYLPPFGGDTGEFQAVILIKTKSGLYGYTKNFVVKGKKSPPVKDTMKVTTLEYTVDLEKKTIPDVTTGKPSSYEAIYDWVRYMKTDILWVLGGQTTGWYSEINPQEPWNSSSIKNIDNLSKSLNKKDVELGAYLMSYFAAGGGQEKGGYITSIGYDPKLKTLVKSRHISLSDEKRLKDIIDLLKYYDKNPNIHYLGLDFIRTGERDGYEMVDEMVELTGVYTPANWANMSKKSRMLWLAQSRVKKEISMKWRWFRAHKEALIIKAIKDSGIKKPLWAFTLGWAQGNEHGQDIYMFFDAGLDYDAAMIYEANRAQHVAMLKSWPRYLNGEYNVLIGNMVDNRLQDGSVRPEIEYMKRIYETEAKFNASSRIRGIFFHDMSRMLWSKFRGSGNSIREWSNINAAVISRIEEKYSENSFTVKIELDEKNRKGYLTVVNRTRKVIEDIDIKPILSGGINSIIIDNYISKLDPSESVIIPFTYSYKKQGVYSSLMSFRVTERKTGEDNVVVIYTLLNKIKSKQGTKTA